MNSRFASKHSFRIPAYLAFSITTLLNLVFVSGVNSGQAADSRPNIIVILSDDMGYSDLGCYGGEIRTPELDDLAENGIRFTQFYNTGRCCPTRASLLSGLYPHQAGMGHMQSSKGWEGYQGCLNDKCVTMAEVLKPAGYGTYGIGKWHVVNNKNVKPDGDKKNWPIQRGFDQFYGTITGAGSFYDPGTLARNNTMISPYTDKEYQPEKYYYTHAIKDHTIKYIKQHTTEKPDQPFFCYVTFTCAHWPMHALEKDIAKYKGHYNKGYDEIRKARYEKMLKLGVISESAELSKTVGDWKNVKNLEWELRCMEVYAAMITSMDEAIGEIKKELKDLNQFENTIIMYMQDNGGCQEGLGRRSRKMVRADKPSLPTIPIDKIRLEVVPKQTRAGFPVLQGPETMPGPEDTYIAYGINWANVSNTPFREYKHFVHEGGISTPLIVSWPQGLAPSMRGKYYNEPGHLIDIMATCIDLAETTYPENRNGKKVRLNEGVSLVPAFKGHKLNRQEPLFWEHEGNRAIRLEKWKLVAKENKPWELYNLEEDRSELHDLAGSMPEKVKQLEKLWDNYAARAQVLPLSGWRKPNPKVFPNANKPKTKKAR